MSEVPLYPTRAAGSLTGKRKGGEQERRACNRLGQSRGPCRGFELGVQGSGFGGQHLANLLGHSRRLRVEG